MDNILLTASALLVVVFLWWSGRSFFKALIRTMSREWHLGKYEATIQMADSFNNMKGVKHGSVEE